MTNRPSEFTGRNLRRSLQILLIPGVSLKRWLAIGSIAGAAVAVGVIFAVKIPTGPAFISFLENVSLRGESPYVRGAVFIGIGVFGVSIALIGLLRSFRQVSQRPRHRNLLDS